ncbi:MAG: hypothetical protein VB142_06340, partial [Burkholderia sp.]
ALLGSYPPIYNGWTTGTVNLISIALTIERNASRLLNFRASVEFQVGGKLPDLHVSDGSHA